MGSVYQYDVKRGQQAVTAGEFYGAGGDLGLVTSVHLQWDAQLIATITFEASDFPENGPFSVPITSVVAGEWIQLNPPSGYTAISPAGAATIAAGPLVIVVPGGTAGGIFVDLGNSAAHRLRVKVVATQAGFLRIHSAGKR